MERSGGREQGRGYRNLKMPSRWLCTSGDCWLRVGRGQGPGQGAPTAQPSGPNVGESGCDLR